MNRRNSAQRFGGHRGGRSAPSLCPQKLCAETAVRKMEGRFMVPMRVRRWRSRLSMNRPVRGMIVRGIELIPLTIIPLTNLWFMVPMRVQNWRSRLSMNLPKDLGRTKIGESASLAVPNLWESNRFMVAMRFKILNWGLSVNRSAEHRLGVFLNLDPDSPRRCSALPSRVSWSQCAMLKSGRLSMNLVVARGRLACANRNRNAQARRPCHSTVQGEPSSPTIGRALGP